ncbi:hypothetical protein B0H13DRAFT_1883679 [Mycena leptocephala]|nr:hypothetical protein B0H13DRAFT_1883679 [Mycena leptocephala]
MALAKTWQTMGSNAEDLAKLQQSVNTSIAIDASGCDDDLRKRLTILATNLKVISDDCNSLMKEAQTSQTFARKEREQKIQVIKSSIAAHVYDFTFREGTSVEKLVEHMVAKGANGSVPNTLF